MGFKSAWEGFTNYLTSTKDEVVSEWDEFQDEIDKTSSYDQSTTSDILQQTANGLSFAAEAVGSLVNNQSTRELASETLEDIRTSESYKEVTQTIDRGISLAQKEASEYLDAHPETKAKLKDVAQTIDSTIDEGMSHAQTFITKHDEAFRNVSALGAIVVAAVPLVKGAKALNAVHTVNKIDINVASLKFSEVRHSQDTISFHKIDRKTQQKFTYDDIKESMAKEGWKGEAVDVVKMPDGKLTSIDNSRVSAAKEVGISIKANVRSHDERLSNEMLDSERFIKTNKYKEIIENPTTWGEAIDNRIANQPAHFRSKEAGYGSHDLPRITGRPEISQDTVPVGKSSNGLLNTEEKLLMAIGVTTAITANKLHENVQSSNTLDQEVLEQRVDPQTYQTLGQTEVQDIQSSEKPFDSVAKAQEIIDDVFPHLASPQTQNDFTNNTFYDNSLPHSVNEYLSQFESQGYENDMGRDID